MSNKKFTPGPWIVFPEHNVMGQKYFSVSYGDDDGQICDFICHEADANLIAAAPEMYESLKDAVQDACGACAMMHVSDKYDFIENGCPFEENEDCKCLSWIRTLRKARGEESEVVK